MERKGRAQVKKDRFKEKQMMMAKDRKITEMMTELPIKEQERIRKEQRLEDGRALKEMKDNMWERWRGKKSKKDKMEDMPTEEVKLDEKKKLIETRIEEYRQEKKRDEERKERRRKLEEHWEMMK